MQSTDHETATKLNELLRGELSAVETYTQAIAHLKDGNIVAIMEEAHNCHAARANALSAKIRDLGEEPALSSGVWGAFAQLLERGAQIFGDASTIAMLEEGEDHGLAQYMSMNRDQDPEIRRLIRDFLPRQQATHNIMRDLKVSLS